MSKKESLIKEVYYRIKKDIKLFLEFNAYEKE